MAFGYYSPISIASGQVPSTQTDFPVLVSQTDARFKTVGNGGHVQNSSGFDIRPYSDSALTTSITGYELERYNATTGEVIMWVKVGSLTSSSTPIYLAYGDSGISTDGSSTTTWSNSFTGVYHLKDGTTLSVADSLNSHNGTNVNGATATSGKIDGAASFASASSQYITLANNIASAAVTISGWANGTSFPNAYNSLAGWNNGSALAILWVKSNGKLACYTDATNYDGTGSNTLSTGTTYYLVMTYSNAAGLVGYVNASSDHTAAAGGILNTGTTASISRDPQNAGRNWNGVMDEVRFSNVVRSANWITTEYNNQNAPGTFETLDAEQVAPSASSSNFLMFMT